MNRRLVRPLAAVACVMSLAAAGIAWQPQSRPARPAGQPGADRPVSVEGSMKQMNRALRQLSRQVGDAEKRDENLRLINDIQRACVNAKGAPLPEGVLKNAHDAAAKAALADEFRRELIKALRLLLDIEADVADGKGDAAHARLQELVKVRDHAHEELGVEEH